MSRHPRASTIKVMEMMDEGILDPREVADMALNALSEAEVHQMAQANDLPYFNGQDEDDDEAFPI